MNEISYEIALFQREFIILDICSNLPLIIHPSSLIPNGHASELKYIGLITDSLTDPCLTPVICKTPNKVMMQCEHRTMHEITMNIIVLFYDITLFLWQ